MPYLSLLAASASRTGAVRKGNDNEDALLVVPDLGHQTQQPVMMLILADGLGGESSASLASQIVVQCVADHIRQQVEHHCRSQVEITDAALREILIGAVRCAHETLLAKQTGGQSTLLCALLVGRRVSIVHIGDSRAYLIKNHVVQQLTKDHSVIQTRYIDTGQMSEEEARSHPLSCALVCAIGMNNLEIYPDVVTKAIGVREWLLLCSDGLWRFLDNDKMLSILSTAETMELACDQLVAAAQRAGSEDDISVILATLQPGRKGER